LHDGELLVTELKQRELGDYKYQRITVNRRLGSIYLNMFTRVEEGNIKAGNGYVHPVGTCFFLFIIDWVLLPPVDTCCVAFNLPFVCSTFTSAVQHCGLDKDLIEGEGLTTFIPVDAAWKQMNFTDLVYLFSPLGSKDLKKILQYHVFVPLLTYYLGRDRDQLWPGHDQGEERVCHPGICFDLLTLTLDHAQARRDQSQGPHAPVPIQSIPRRQEHDGRLCDCPELWRGECQEG
jgi:uncharacterized surface protein with fasciclin (FAS1) repeats